MQLIHQLIALPINRIDLALGDFFRGRFGQSFGPSFALNEALIEEKDSIKHWK